MKINDRLLRQIVSDLGLDTPFVKGRDIPVKNCWHFSTDGNAVDAIFIDEEDFINGMNRIYVLAKKHKIIILAFSLMDTHVHFILWGSFEDCNRFMHDYVRATSRHIAITHGDRNKMADVPIHHQVVDTDFYLKTVICYVIKNAPVGGIQFNGIDYPWSSGPLYFRRPVCPADSQEPYQPSFRAHFAPEGRHTALPSLCTASLPSLRISSC